MASPELVSASASTRRPQDVQIERLKRNIALHKALGRHVAIVRIADLEPVLERWAVSLSVVA